MWVGINTVSVGRSDHILFHPEMNRKIAHRLLCEGCFDFDGLSLFRRIITSIILVLRYD